MTPAQADAWLSSGRFRPFLNAAGGDHARAVLLYEWHAQLTSSCFRLVHHFEVLVRNAVDHVLGARQPQQPIEDTWLTDFKVLTPNAIKQVIPVIERLTNRKQHVSRGKVVADLSFGFWPALFGSGYEALWRAELYKAFPHGAGLTRKKLIVPMEEIRKFRNRLAHHDCLLAQPVSVRRTEILDIAGWVDPDARRWIEANTDVDAVVARRP